MAEKTRKKNPTPMEVLELALEQSLLADNRAFLHATANVLEKHCSNLNVENHDEIDDAVQALRFSLTRYEAEPNTGEDDE